MATRYRVLSLDGGGSWALIQVKALIELFPAREATQGRDVLREFDLVAANSGGSIVLGCLIANFTLGQTLAFFLAENQRRAVFSKTDKIADRVIEGLLHFGPKYSAEQKLPALRNVLGAAGDQPLPDAVKGIMGHGGAGLRVLIVGFDYDRLRARFFRSIEVSGNDGTGAAAELTLAEAIHASTNAPVNYFDAPATYPDRPERYWDGAITGDNNPVLAGVTEAVIATSPGTEIIALSIGTATVALPWPTPGEQPSPYLRQPSEDGLKNDLSKLAGAVLDDPPDMASFVAHVLTRRGIGLPEGIDSRIVRMNPMVSPERDASGAWTAPGDLTLDDFLALKDLNMDAIEQPEVESIAHFADLWLQDRTLNQPVRMDGDSLACEIGQPRFSAAKAAWQMLCL